MKANPNKYGLKGETQEKQVAPRLIPAMPVSKAGPQQHSKGAKAVTTAVLNSVKFAVL